MHIAVLYAAAVSFDTAVFYVLSLVTALLLPLFGSDDVAGRLACMWSVSAIRRVLIWTFIQPGVNKADKAMMKRWATVHCFLGSVYDSGRQAAFGGPVESGNGPFDSPGSTALITVAAATACVVWERTVPDPTGESDRKDGKKKAGELFMRVMCLLKLDWPILLGAFTFLLLAVFCELFALLQTGKLIDFLGSEYQWQKFPSAVFLLGVYGFGSSLCTACREGLFSCTVSRFSCRVKFRLFGSLVHQEIGFFDTTKTGEISNRLCTDTGLMGNAVSLSVNLLLRTVIELLGIAFVMLGLSWKLTVLVLMETPLMSLLQSIFNVYFQVFSKEVQDSMARENDAVGEAVAGIRTVRSFSTERVEAQRYDNRLMDTHKLKTRREIARGVYTLLRKVSDLGMRFAVLCYGRKLVESGQMSAGTLVFFIFYQRDLGIRIKTMIYIFGDMVNSVNVAEKVFEYLDRKPLVSVGGTLQPDALKGHVHFHNLTFSYPTRPEQPVLQALSLELKPGQMTALVGPSGGGKSTCVSLLERFYEPQEGQILLDGQPLHSYQHQYLHRKVAMVGQEPVLFSGSIRDNIAYGLKHCPLEKVQEAARRANAHGFISQLEHGYDTDVGERGGQLSAGQKQRIAIARALVREPQVLILDEVTSSLDTETEHLVLQALANCSSLTILVIAHRLKTVERADQIFLIDRGVSLEQGTHQELMDRKGKYYRLQGKIFIEESPQC